MDRRAMVFVGSVAVWALVGCGGGSSGSTFSTNVPASSPVNTLTPTQGTQLCNDINSYFTKEISSPGACEASAIEATAMEAAQNPALTDQQLQAACATFEPLVCALLMSPDSGLTGGTGDGGASTCDTSGCTATVSQISACLNATGAALTQWEGMFGSCSSVTRARLATVMVDGGPMEPAACTALDATCGSLNPMSSSIASVVGR